MRRITGSAMIAAGLALTPALATAQHGMSTPKHELGVDVAAYWASYSLAGVSSSNVNLMTPVDVRIAFVSKGTTEFEPRLAFSYASGAFGGTSQTIFRPDLNVLFTMGKAKAHNDNKYVTAGIGLAAGGGVTQLALNGGVGMRSPYESGAIRLEGFLAYLTKDSSKGVPSTFAVGVRAGLSLWH